MQKGWISWTRMGLGKCRRQLSIERCSGSAAGMHGMDGVNGVPISAWWVPWCPHVPPEELMFFNTLLPSCWKTIDWHCSASSTAWPWKIIGVIHSSMKKHKGDVTQISPFIISCCYLQMWSDSVIIRFWLVVWIPTLSVSLPICLG